MFKPNPIFKRNLIQEIVKARLSADDQMKTVIKASAVMIQHIQKETKETIAKLHRFVSLCDVFLSQITQSD